MKALWVVLGLVGLLVIVLLFAGGSYIGAKNTMVQKNEAVHTGILAGQRRPATPSGPDSKSRRLGQGDTSTRETTVLTNIANARAGVLAAGSDRGSQIQANAKLDVALGPFFRLQEQYPNLKGQ